VSTIRAELWIAFQPVAAPSGEIVMAFDAGLGGGGVVGAVVCASDYVESRTSSVSSREMRYMKVMGSRK